MLKQINQLIGDDFKSVPKIPIPSLSEYYGYSKIASRGIYISMAGNNRRMGMRSVAATCLGDGQDVSGAVTEPDSKKIIKERYKIQPQGISVPILFANQSIA
jgi:hypothetical protein